MKVSKFINCFIRNIWKWHWHIWPTSQRHRSLALKRLNLLKGIYFTFSHHNSHLWWWKFHCVLTLLLIKFLHICRGMYKSVSRILWTKITYNDTQLSLNINCNGNGNDGGVKISLDNGLVSICDIFLLLTKSSSDSVKNSIQNVPRCSSGVADIIY